MPLARKSVIAGILFEKPPWTKMSGAAFFIEHVCEEAALDQNVQGGFFC